MSLKVWLPLIRDVNNQGTKDITVSNNGATLSTGGKLGGCYYFNGSSQYLQFSDTLGDIYVKDFTWAVWLKPSDSTRGVIVSEYSSSGSSNVAFELSASLGVRVYWNGSPDIYPTGCTLTKDVWTHVAIVKTTNKIDFYINGEHKYTYTGTLSDRVSTSKIRVGDDYRGGTSVSYMGYINDFRIYDHALSLKEVQLLARGLVAHYPLNDPYSTNNLIRNGFGELEMENWTGTLASNSQNTDLPTADTNIKRAYYNNQTSDYIPINRMNTYTLSMYIKQKATSGTTYPSILTYDADKKFISPQMTPDGFVTATYTTLSSALNTGDTVIHATDLSQWTVASGNYRNSCAVFGYVDGLGYKYSDRTYTQDVPRFASGTAAKTNIDKTTNTITLNSAYTGKPRPAGTVICQTTDGSTYYYPWGGINVANVTDWTFKTVNLTPNSINRLRWARYIKWMNYGSSPLYYAGLKLIDTTNSEAVYDVSGNKYHMTKNGNTTVSGDTVRYSKSMYFDGNSYLSSSELLTEIKSISVWFKTTKNKATSQMIVCVRNSKLCASLYNNCIISYLGDSSAGAGSKCTIGSSYIENGWNHLVVISTGTNTRDVYINGVKQTATSNDYWSANVDGVYIGTRMTSTPLKFYGYISDVRLYATPLSEEDILDLYQNSAHLDNKGNLTAYEFIEG